MHILSTLVRPDAGEARVAGHDLFRAPQRVRGAIGVTGQFSAVDGVLTGEQNLRLMADLLHLPAAEGRRRTVELLERFELTDAARRPAFEYSGGMRRRLDLAMSLIGKPALLFLDEPTTGLDPTGRRGMWGLIRQLVGEGVTVFLTTQYLDEAEGLADRVAVLDHGGLVAEGTVAQLKARVPGGHVTLRFGDPAALETASTMPGVVASDTGALQLQVRSNGSVGSVRGVLDWLDGHRVVPDELSIHTPDLNDVFLTLTGL